VKPLWRDEFSIDTATDSYVTRRQFSKFLILTSLGMFVGNLWILIRSWFRPKTAFAEMTIGSVADMAVGDVKLFTYPSSEDPCILIRTATEEFAAFSQKCTHLSCAVYYSKDNDRLECPCHEGYFSAKDGSVLQGPPPRSLPNIRLRRAGDSMIATGVQI
jgi:arsenite oxidase small subunit